MIIRKKILFFSLAALALCGAAVWLFWRHDEQRKTAEGEEHSRTVVARLLADQKSKSEPVWAMLKKAREAMRAGVWRVEKSSGLMDETGKLFDGNSMNFGSELIAVGDIDLAWDGVRVMGDSGKLWSSGDDGRTWQEVNLRRISTEERFFLSFESPDYDQFLPYYKILGTETHDAEKWLHVQVTEGVDPEGGEHFWLLLDNGGNAVSVRRFAEETGEGISVGGHGSGSCMVEDFTPVTDDENIGGPVGKITNGL